MVSHSEGYVYKKIQEKIQTGCGHIRSAILTQKTERAVIIAGKTGSGKSTLLNMLAGSVLAVKKDERYGRLYVTHSGAYVAKIGLESHSETEIPEVYIDSRAGIAYWDTPGYNDTRGTDTNIANAYVMKRLLEYYQQKKILIVIDWVDIEEVRGSRFDDLMRYLNEMFDRSVKVCGHDSEFGSYAIVVNKVPADYNLTNVTNLLKRHVESCSIENKLYGTAALVMVKTILEKNKLALINAPTVVSVAYQQEQKANIIDTIKILLKSEYSDVKLEIIVKDYEQIDLTYLINEAVNVLMSEIKRMVQIAQSEIQCDNKWSLMNLQTKATKNVPKKTSNIREIVAILQGVLCELKCRYLWNNEILDGCIEQLEFYETIWKKECEWVSKRIIVEFNGLCEAVATRIRDINRLELEEAKKVTELEKLKKEAEIEALRKQQIIDRQAKVRETKMLAKKEKEIELKEAKELKMIEEENYRQRYADTKNHYDEMIRQCLARFNEELEEIAAIQQNQQMEMFFYAYGGGGRRMRREMMREMMCVNAILHERQWISHGQVNQQALGIKQVQEEALIQLTQTYTAKIAAVSNKITELIGEIKCCDEEIKKIDGSINLTQKETDEINGVFFKLKL